MINQAVRFIFCLNEKKSGKRDIGKKVYSSVLSCGVERQRLGSPHYLMTWFDFSSFLCERKIADKTCDLSSI